MFMAARNPNGNFHASSTGAKDCRVHSFLFLKPLTGLNIKGLSQKLLGANGIKDISITETTYGFIVNATACNSCKDLGSEIAESLKSRYGVSLSYYGFKH